MIIQRYLNQEIFRNFLGVTGVLLLIALSNKFVSLLAKAASGELPAGIVFKVVALTLPELFCLLAPLGLFLAILLGYGRMYCEQEMVVLQAAGVKPRKLLSSTLIGSVLLMLLVGFMTLWLIPKVNMYKEYALTQDNLSLILGGLSPGKFHTTQDGRLVFYVEELSHSHKHMQGVFIAEQPVKGLDKTNPWELVSAKEAHLVVNDQDNRRFLELHDGVRYEGLPGQANYMVVKFKRYGRLLEKKPIEVPPLRRTTSTRDLWHSEALGNIAELQWRLSLPISVIVLSLLALPLSRVAPRQGRFARMLPAIIIFIVYFNLLSVNKRWVESGVIPSVVGVWWVHLVLGIVALLWFAKQQRWRL